MTTTRVAGAAIGVGLAMALMGSVAPASAAEPSAADVVAKNVAARGGLDAWRKVQTMVWTGRIESARAPTPLMPFRLDQKRPGKTRLEIDAPGYRSVRAFDGYRGWRVPPGHGLSDVRPYTIQELKFAQASHVIDGPLVHAAANGRAVTLVGVDDVERRKAYHLKISARGGGDEEVWVDAETWLELRYDRVAEEPDGKLRRVSASYGDYRPVEGLQVPFLIQTGGGPGEAPDRMRIEHVALNAPLDDAIFGNPAAPSARQAARPGLAPRVIGSQPAPHAAAP